MQTSANADLTVRAAGFADLYRSMLSEPMGRLVELADEGRFEPLRMLPARN